MDLHLKDKRALVSGSTAGIGLAIATALAREGAAVVVNGRQPPRVAEGVGQFMQDLARREGKSAAAVEADFFKNARPTSLIRRFATPEEVANLVAFVCSPLAAATTGAALRVDGGVVRSIA